MSCPKDLVRLRLHEVTGLETRVSVLDAPACIGVPASHVIDRPGTGAAGSPSDWHELNTVRRGTKICTILAIAIASTVLAGCSRPAVTVGTGQSVVVAAHGKPSTSTTLTGDTNCAPNLDLGRADNGTSRCVCLGGQVSVGLVSTSDMSFSQIGLTGSSLTLQPLPTPFGVFIYKATSRGTTVLTAAANICSSSDGTRPCPPVTPWSVTVTVQ
jgi:hypothetical protein